MESLIRDFDESLSSVIEERTELHSELKYSELTMICLYEELQIVRSTQEEDDRLVGRASMLGVALKEMEAKVS